jgi:hypothetical protein
LSRVGARATVARAPRRSVSVEGVSPAVALGAVGVWSTSGADSAAPLVLPLVGLRATVARSVSVEGASPASALGAVGVWSTSDGDSAAACVGARATVGRSVSVEGASPVAADTDIPFDGV